MDWNRIGRWTVLLFGAGLLVCTAGCGETTVVLPEGPAASMGETETFSSAPNGPLTAEGVYTDPQKTFQVTVPSDWHEDTAQSKKDRVVLLSPGGNRSVELKKLEMDANLLAYSQETVQKTYAASFSAFQLQSFSTVTANGHKGILLQFTCQKAGKRYTVLQGVLAGESDYSITYAAIDGDEKFLTMARESIETFRELDPIHDPSVLAGRLDGQTYHDTDSRFTVTVPKGWSVEEQQKDQVLFVSADGKSNINVQCTPADKQLLRYKKDYFMDYFRQSLSPSVKITQFSTATVSGEVSRYLVCQYPYAGQTLVSKQYLLNSGDTTYSLTFTSSATSAGKTDFSAVAKRFTVL